MANDSTFKLPNVTVQTTKSAQLAVLGVVCENAAQHFKLLEDQKKQISKMLEQVPGGGSG